MNVMTTTEIIGDIVHVFVGELDALKQLGFDENPLVVQIVGADDMGLWAAHPNYVIVKTVDHDGKPLPEDQRVRRQLEANFLIRWEQINTIVHFPHLEGFDLPSPFERPIGFVLPKDTDGAEGGAQSDSD